MSIILNKRFQYLEYYIQNLDKKMFIVNFKNVEYLRVCLVILNPKC